MEQSPINSEVAKALNLKIDEIDVTKEPGYVKQYTLKVTPTTLILADGKVRERFESVVHRDQIESAIRKYL
jgi:thioredoxin 1